MIETIPFLYEIIFIILYSVSGVGTGLYVEEKVTKKLTKKQRELTIKQRLMLPRRKVAYFAIGLITVLWPVFWAAVGIALCYLIIDSLT